MKNQFKQTMIKRGWASDENEPTWTKLTISSNHNIVLKQFDGDTLDCIALSKEDIRKIFDIVNKEVA